MAKKTLPGKDKQIASAFLLSYPQMFVWALVFAAIGGVTVWSSKALNTDINKHGDLVLRMVSDYNHDNQPNWNDMVTFDSTSNGNIPIQLRIACYQNGNSVLTAQKPYGRIAPTPQNRYIQLSSNVWLSGSADCHTDLLDVSKPTAKVLNSYNFHVNP